MIRVSPWKLLVAWLLACVPLLPYVFTSHFHGDEFIFTNTAKRIADGQSYGRDFFQFVMPGNFMLVALAYKLFGPSLLVARVVQDALVAAMAVAYYRLARAMGVRRGLAVLPAAVLLVVIVGQYFGYSHRWFSQAGVAFTLGLAWVALGRGPRAWGLVGLGAGLTYVMQQMDGMALLLGLLAGQAWLAWRGEATPVRRLGWFALGWAVPMGSLALYLFANGGLWETFYGTHLWALGHYRAAGNHNDVAYATDLAVMLDTTGAWISRAYWYALEALVVVGTFLPLLVSLASAFWLVGLGRRPGDRATSFSGVLACVAGCAFLAATRGRADFSHVLAVSMPHYLLLGVAIARWEQLPLPDSARGLRWLPAASLAAVVFAGVVCFEEQARQEPQAWFPHQLPDAAIQASPTFQAVAARVKPGDTLVVGAHDGLFTFYLAPSATRFDIDWTRPEDGYTTPEQYAVLKREVEARRPRLLLMTTTTRAEADGTLRDFLPGYHHVAALPSLMITWEKSHQTHVYERN